MFLKISVIVGDKLQFLAQIRFLSIDTKGDGMDHQKAGGSNCIHYCLQFKQKIFREYSVVEFSCISKRRI